MEELTERIVTSGKVLVNEKDVQINFEREAGKMPANISANQYEQTGQSINVSVNVATGAVNYTVNNSTVSAATTAVQIQAIRAKVAEIISNLQTPEA